MILKKLNFLVILLLVFNIGCKNKSSESNHRVKIKPVPNTKAEYNENNLDNYYSDSMIQSLILANSNNEQELLNTDTLSNLLSLESYVPSIKAPTIIDLNLIETLHSFQNPLSNDLKEILGCTQFICKLKSFDKVSYYLLLQSMEESHFSDRIFLFGINAQSKNISQLLLSGFYGSENYEKTTSSEFQADGNIKLSEHVFQNIYDETGEFISKENSEIIKYYRLHEDGRILLIKK